MLLPPSNPNPRSLGSFPVGRGTPRITTFLVILALASSAVPPRALAQTTAQPQPPLPPSAAAQGFGKLSVTVTNTDTQQALEGARVEIVGRALEAYTDGLGVAALDRVPAGQVQIRVSYTGLNPQTQSLELYADDHASLDINLRAEVYKLATLTVTGEREGNAAAITSQRNAPNVKTVVSMDAFGDLANQNPGEVLIRLPGITPIMGGEGEVFAVNVRGMAPKYNSVTVDGTRVASNAPLGREFRFATMAAGLFGEIEVIKALTPDVPADSLGGTVNLKTKTALKMRGGPEFSYRAATKWQPGFYDFIPRRQHHRISPQFQLSYRQLFNAFGGKRNLSVTADASHMINRIGTLTSNVDYQFTLDDPAYMFRYHTREGLGDTERTSVNTRIDYKLKENLRVWFSTMFTWQDGKVAPGMEQYSTDFEASRTLATANPDTGELSATGVILPGWTNDVTEVRGGITGGGDSSHFQITQGANGFLDDQHRFHVGLEWKPRAWTIDLVAAYSRSRVDLRGGERKPASALQMVATVRGVGWRVDKSKSAEFPELVQTEGPDIADLSNYEDGHVVKYYGGRDASVSTAALNIKRIQRIGIPIEFGAGGVVLRSKIAEIGGQTRWYYAGLDGIRDTGDEDLSVFRDPNFQRDTRFHDPSAPAFNMTAIGQSLASHPGRWVEDIYYRESERLQDTRDVREDIYAGYLMAKTVIGRARILAGVRYEKTDVWGTGYEKVGSYPNITDPHERLAAEFRDRVTHKGAYDNFFPSVHVKYAITPNLLARASWSTAIGRPEPTNLIPQFAPNISERTLTIDNPGLGPQYANNFDVSLEYYFEPIGVFGISEFRKNIKNFIYIDTGSIIGYGPDNGYDGLYEGYELRRNMNGGRASVEGIELAWQQQLSIISDALKGVSAYANYTYLRTKGNYGTGEQRGTGAVAGFIPRAANLGLRYNYRDFGCRLSMIHTGSYLDGFATNLSRRRYIRGRTVWNAGITWRFSRQFRLFIDFNNLTDVPIEYYRGKESRPSTTVYGGPNINMGVNGLF